VEELVMKFAVIYFLDSSKQCTDMFIMKLLHTR